MLGRFDPIELMQLDNRDKLDLETEVDRILAPVTGSRRAGWKMFVSHRDDIVRRVQWILDHAPSIENEFPRTKAGIYIKNRHVLVKQYAKSRQATGQSLFSRGFSGSNYRLVVSSDNQRVLSCRWGEYSNLTGYVLRFRKSYPKARNCDLCHASDRLRLCVTCGCWFCAKCSYHCQDCDSEACSVCGESIDDLLRSPHDWYYH